ncbi:MAG: VCBS domain-containing protein [Deferribacterales bacterium]
MAAIGKVVQVIGQAVLHGIDGSVKQIFPGDMVAVGDVIETMSGSKVILQLENGREVTIGANEHLAIDDSLVASFDDVAMDAEALQDALEKGEDLSPEDEETAAGEDTGSSVLVSDVLEGDDSEGYVGSYLLPSSSLESTTDTEDSYTDTGNNNNDETTTSTATGDPVYSLAEGATVPPGFVLNSDGSYTIDPTISDYDYLGEGEDVEYDVDIVITYPDGSTEDGVINVVVTGTNDAPVAYAEVISAVEDGNVVTGQLTAVDPDVNDTLTFEVASSGVPDGFTLNSDGTYSFDPSSYDYLAAGEQTTLTVDYMVTDPYGETSYETITIVVTGTNDAPVVSDISYSGTEDTSITITAEELLAQATDVDGDDLSIVEITNVTGGTIVDNGDGTYTFTPDQDFNGQATFEFSVTDGTETVTATGKIDIAAVNDAPVAEAVTAETEEDSVLTGQLTATDVDGDDLTFATKGAVPEGFTLNSDGSYEFNTENYDYLAVGESETYVVSYTVTDDSGAVTESKITITVTGTNDAPVAEAAVGAVDEDSTITGQLTATDADDGAVLTFSTDSTVDGFTLNSDGSYTFDASGYDYLAAGETAAIEIPYTVTDENGATSTSKLTITVTGTNDAAVVSSDTVDLTESDTVLTTGGVLTITDVDSDATFEAQTDTQGAYGKFSIGTDGTWTYTTDSTMDGLAEGETVTETFTVKSSDGTETTVTVNITGTNDAAVVSSDTVNLTESDTVLTTGGVLTITDVDSDATFEAQTDTQGAYGKFSIGTDGTWTYTTDSTMDSLAAGETVTETFTVKSADGTETTVTVNITGTNDAAVVSSDTVNLTESDTVLTTGGVLTITDVDSDATFEAQTDTQGAYGKFSIGTDGTWTYTTDSTMDSLAAGETVTETFTVKSADGTETTVTVNITGTNDAAVVSSDTVNLTESDAVLTAGGILTITDVDSDATFEAQTDTHGAYGKFSIGTDGAWTYTTDSTMDSLAEGETVTETFTVKSADGTETTVTVNITGTNDAAVVSSDTVNLTESDAVLTTGGILTITDVDSDATFEAQTDTQGTYGKFSIGTDGAWTYTTDSTMDSLAEGETVTETFTVKSADGTETTVTVNITGTNDAAVVSSDTVNLTESDTVLTTGGVLTITDVDSDATFEAQTDTQGAYGKFSIGTDGTWTYTTDSTMDSLAEGETVTETFTVKSADGTETTVTVNITGTNDAAVVSSDTVNLTESDTVLTTGGVLTITDVDSDATFEAQTDTQGAYGKFSIGTDGTWTYTTDSTMDSLADGETVTETFTVKSADGTETTVTVNITGTNDAAVVSSDTVDLTESDAVLTTGGVLTITDVDSDATFEAQTDTQGAYGKFSIGTDGTWTYTTDSTMDSLADGETVTETFTVKSADGTETTVTVNITGTNDAAVVSSDTVNLTESDAVLTTGGVLTITDVDSASEFEAQTDTQGTYGKFSIGTDGTWTYTTDSTMDSLAEGETVTETFTVKSADGTETTVTVNITGTNDAAVVSSDTVNLTESDTVLTTGGVLTITDVDSDATFEAQTDTHGAYGKFSIGTDGTWTYTTDSTMDSLAEGETVTETFTVKSADGTETTVTVNITGTNDAAVVSSDTVNLTESDAVLTTGGILTITDVDSDATFEAQTDTQGAYGKFSIGTDGAWTYTTDSTMDGLAEGETVTETFTVKSADGTETTVTVNITGTNDAAVVSSDTVNLTESDAVLTTGGILTITDVDSDATFEAQTDTQGAYGKFSIGTDGAWTYTTDSTMDSLAAGETVTETFTVKSADGTETTVTVNITGTNDAAVVSSDTVDLTESDTVLTTGGVLTITDVDSASEFEAQTDTQGTYGKFSIGTDGAWTYTTDSTMDGLAEGETVTETFTVKSADGTETTVTVNITGTNDAAVVSSDTVNLTESDAVLTTGGILTITDVDSDATFEAQTDTQGAYGKFSIGTDGAWTYTTDSTMDSLAAGETVTETFTVKSADGTETTVTVNITGTNDAAVVSSDTVDLTESDTVLTTGGVLTITDVDSASEFEAQTDTQGTYGKFSIGTDGAWTYTTDSTMDSLADGETVTETFTVKSADGTETTVTVNITGTNDAAVVSSDTVNLTESDAVLTTGGVLTITDVDSDATFEAQTDTQGAYGKFSIGTDGAWTYTTDSTMDGLAEGETVTETFTVKSADGTETTVTVNITGTNDGPVAGDVEFTTSEDTAIILTAEQILAQSDDVDGDDLTIASITNVTGGELVDNGDGTYTFTPDTDFNGDATFEFTVTDGTDISSATAKIVVTSDNDAPVTEAKNESVYEDTVLTGSIGATDADGDSLTYALVGTAPTGFTLNEDGTYTFDANSYDSLSEGETVDYEIRYSVSDGNGGTVESVLNIQVIGTNDAPVAHNVGISVSENGNSALLSLIASDVDSDQSDLTYALVEGQDIPDGLVFDADSKTVQFSAGSSYDYLTKGETVTYTVKYTVTDEYGASDEKSITITINGANDKPVISIENVETDVTFVSDGGSYTNALGVYTTDEDGNIVSGEFILLNSDTASVNELLATYQGEDVKFFIVTNVGSSFSGGEVTFTTDENGDVVLLVDGEEISNNVFYSDAELNSDGLDHFIENADGTIGIEDLVSGTGGYDGDFNDLVVKTTTYNAVYTENEAPISIASDVSISDVDSTEMKSMTITLTNMKDGDVLTVGDLPDGITVVSIENGVVKLEGVASVEDYEAALKAVMFSSTSEDPSTEDRVFRVVVTDDTGQSSGYSYVTLAVEAVDETYEAPVAVDDTATVTEVNDTIITGAAEVTKVETGTELNSDVSPESLGYTTATTYSTVSMNQNISVNSGYVIIENVPYTFNVNGDSGNGFVEIGNVASGATVNVNIGGGNDIVYLSGTVTGYVNVNGDSGYDVLVLSGSESDYTITTVNNNGTISAYITTADGGYIVANNIEEIRYGGYSESSYEYEVDVVTSQTLTDEGYVVIAVANGTLSAGVDNGDGTWTVSADELDGLTIIPNGAGTPDAAVVEVVDSGYVTDISDSIAQGNLITGTGADYDSDTSVSNLYITEVDGTTVSSTGETAIQGEYGTLYVKEDGTYRYELDNDSENLDNVNSDESVTEDFTYTLSDGTSTSEAKLTITVNGADDISISASSSVVDEGSTSVPVANLLFMIDVSGSMGNVITSEGDTRLDVLKDALSDLIDKYEEKGDIGGIQIVTFSTDAYSQTVNGSVWLTVDQAKSILESLRANGATDYDDALSKLMTTYSSDSAPSADYTHAYFVSDGAPSSEDYKINSSELAAWQSWLGDTVIDEVYAVGIGSGTDSEQLQIVAWSADGEGYADNVLVVPDDTLNADISAAAEQNSRESSVFNDVDIPDGLEAHLTTVTYAGLVYEFSDTVTEYTIDLGDNGSVVINSDGSYVFTAGTDVDQDVTSLLKYSFEVNEHDYSGTLSLTTENHIENIGDFSTYTSGYSVTETDSGFGVKGNYYDSSSKSGIGSGESLTIDFDSEVNTAKFDISGTVKSGSTYSVYDSDGNWVSNGTVTSGELTITSESGIGHVVFSGSSSSNYYVEPVSVEAKSGSDNVLAVFGDADSLDFSGLSDIDAIQMNDDSTAQTVTLSAQDVLSIADSDTHTLQVSGDSADTLVLSGDWKSTGDNTYCSTVNGTEVCIEINNDEHKLNIQFTDQGDGISG